jgi:hypothetical protein
MMQVGMLSRDTIITQVYILSFARPFLSHYGYVTNYTTRQVYIEL